ncbi:MAG TPA: hypothetical protein VEX60_08980 [Pyrinomonadaceae bacterium]|nr:hypothetical protein [Pyrinomonadaceae bacterium]
MTKRIDLRRSFARLCYLALALACAAVSLLPAASAKRVQDERADIRLRSLTTRATGRLTVEPSEGGGRARLTAIGLPEPQTVAEGATTYVVWALSGGRIVRVGELRRDERGNGGLAFDRPSEFERYGVIVTAEPSADVVRPGDPVLTTRADEAAALYPSEKKNESAAGNAPMPGPPPLTELTPKPRVRRASGDFYSEVDNALAANGGGRVLELEGDTATPQARGAARATLSSNRAYVRVNFRGVPLPSSVGASVYVLWAIVPDGRIVYMGSLPSDEAINIAEVYVRVAGFDADDYALFVTAERARPVASPSGRRALSTKLDRTIVK